jgi:hypothetical protein
MQNALFWRRLNRSLLEEARALFVKGPEQDAGDEGIDHQ